MRSDFLAFSAAWVVGTLDSVFAEDFKNRKWHQLLAGGQGGALDLNVNAAPAAAAPTITRLDLNKRAVFLRTVAVRDLNGADRSLGLGGDVDMYARITVNNQEYTEAMQLDRESIRPAWTTMRFVDADLPVVIVHYELWDEDGALRGGDDHLDIHPDGRFKDLDFLFNMNTRQLGGQGIEGVFDSPARLFVTQGKDSDRAQVQFFVTVKTLARTGTLRPLPFPLPRPLPPVIR